MKIFDYKFLLTLGLSLIVYFLYREVDILTKRVIVLENTKEKKKIELIELPQAPEETNIQDNEQLQMLEIILEKAKKSETKMVEEYSNDNHNIYSHDNLHTNTNDNDTLMVESILNMVKDDINQVSEQIEQVEQVEKIEPIEPIEQIEQIEHIEQIEESLESENINNNVESSDESNIILFKDNNSNKISLETLNKKKLDELQELASKYNIEINYENGKKKKKSDLAQEIFNKQ
jgi:hypothetical protein